MSTGDANDSDIDNYHSDANINGEDEECQCNMWIMNTRIF